MVNEVREKIVNLIKPKIKCYYIEAPSKESLPYCVFSFVSNTVDYDSASQMQVFLLQVSIFGTDLSFVERIKKDIENLFYNAENSLSTTVYKCLSVNQQSNRFDKINDVWSVYLQYKMVYSN